MEKYKYLFKNLGVLTISNFATKFVTFFLIPIYTSYLTTAEYGVSDLFNSTVSLLIPILTMCISSSVLRFMLDADISKSEVIFVSSKYIIRATIIFLVLYCINFFLNVIPELTLYKGIFIILFIVYLLNTWLTSVAKGLERITDISIASVMSTTLTIVLNVVFLTELNLGIYGYFYATIIGISVANIFLIYRTKLISFLGNNRKNKTLETDMALYGEGLIVNSVSWWINSSLDRYFVLFICGISENGILSAAYKLPTIVSTVQGVFEQAWILSAVKNYDKDDKDHFFINTYNMYGFVVIMVTSLIIVFDKLLASFLYKNEFYVAWKLVPILSISVVFCAASGFFGAILAAEKKTRAISYTTMVGAITNAILNLVLISAYGIIGAAIATLISNIVIWITRLLIVKKYVTLQINMVRDLSCYVILIVQSLLLFKTVKNTIIYLIMGGLLFFILLLYFTEIRELTRRFVEIIKKRRRSKI